MLTKIQIKQLPKGFHPIEKSNPRRNQTAKFLRSMYIPYSPTKMIFSERKTDVVKKKKNRKTKIFQKLARKIQRLFSPSKQ